MLGVVVRVRMHVGAPKVMELKGHKSQVMCVSLSADGKRAVTASKDGTLRVWNIDVRYAQQEDPKTLLVVSFLGGGEKGKGCWCRGPGRAQTS